MKYERANLITESHLSSHLPETEMQRQFIFENLYDIQE